MSADDIFGVNPVEPSPCRGREGGREGERGRKRERDGGRKRNRGRGREGTGGRGREGERGGEGGERERAERGRNMRQRGGDMRQGERDEYLVLDHQHLGFRVHLVHDDWPSGFRV